MTTTKKICQGNYVRIGGGRSVAISYFSPPTNGATFTGWIARAEWTNDTYTDPLPTKRDAIRAADVMIQGAVEVTRG